MFPLKKLLRKIDQQEIWEYDPDVPHHRIKGQFGSEVRVFGKKLNHIVLSIDISKPADVINKCDEAIEFIDNYYKGLSRRYKNIHLNLWAESSYIVQSLALKKLSLLDEIKNHYQAAIKEIPTEKAIASSIIKPYFDSQVWAKIKPDLLIIFSSTRLENDISSIQKSRFNRFWKNTIWIYIPNGDDANKSPILNISPNAGKYIIILND